MNKLINISKENGQPLNHAFLCCIVVFIVQLYFELNKAKPEQSKPRAILKHVALEFLIDCMNKTDKRTT